MVFAPLLIMRSRETNALGIEYVIGTKTRKERDHLVVVLRKREPILGLISRSLSLRPHEVGAARACCQFRRTGMTIKYGWGWAEICPSSLALHALRLNVTYHTRWTIPNNDWRAVHIGLPDTAKNIEGNISRIWELKIFISLHSTAFAG